MSVAIITGSAGLVGSEAVRYFAAKGLEVIGIDNDMRARFFGEEASTIWQKDRLLREVKSYRHHSIDIRDAGAIDRLFERYGKDVCLVIHAAAQPSHDWAAREPLTDFTVNANGTLNLLEATRRFAPLAAFIFTSTNKVYGDRPNHLPLCEQEKRWEIAPSHAFKNGIPEDFPLDQCLHSLFGTSKVAADLVVQEYGRYFGMRTVCFRGGCLTGPGHSGTELHGFLSYLVRCAVSGVKYTVFGYGGKQVRDNIHSADLIHAFAEFFKAPRCGEVYNIGGGRVSNCSVLEAIDLCPALTGNDLKWEYTAENRRGDHIWYVSDLSKFMGHYPNWKVTHTIPDIIREIYEKNAHRWLHQDRARALYLSPKPGSKMPSVPG
jgi:CDP-paratose 2-epimerase